MHTSEVRDPIASAEAEIDSDFLNSPLMQLQYDQAIWTLLSTVEDRYLKIVAINPLPNEQQVAYIDTLVNAIAHPARALFHKRVTPSPRLIKDLIDEHYQWAHEWIDSSIIYNAFNLIFPLWHRKKLKLALTDNYIDTGDLEIESNKYGYEAYNRIVQKDGNHDDKLFDVEAVAAQVMQNTSIKGQAFTLNFNPKLVALLRKTYSESLGERYVLPSDWTIGEVTFNNYKIVFTTIQAMLYGWFIARIHVAAQGLLGVGYSSSLWIINHDALVNRLARYTSLDSKAIAKVLDYLKFGSREIRDPDIAVQPLVEISDNQLVLSPLLWINTNAERNFCTLLNKIPAEREAYLNLTLSKEAVLYEELKGVLERLGYEVTRGTLISTDIDIAIIDRKNKICACIELKWFIEPSEIRETIERSLELEKGIKQSKKISSLLKAGDKQLTQDMLKIDNTYRTASFVGARNWIGYSDIQSQEIPIIKIWHFVKKLIELESLDQALNWLESRSYLPQNGRDYWVVPVDLDTGSWRSRWYGIAVWPPRMPPIIQP